jgi:hypothetical protein
MDEKNKNALLQWGPRKILSDLVNLPDQPSESTLRSAGEFVERYGALTRAGRGEPDYEHLLVQSHVAIRYAGLFRSAWPGPERNIQLVNEFLDAIFAAAWTFDRGEHPAIRADFATGTWKPEPRTLLDVLGITLMESRKMLYRCERPDCQKYFVKAFSRDRYCSNRCSELMRSRGQLQWQRDNREIINARRRKPSKKKGRKS